MTARAPRPPAPGDGEPPGSANDTSRPAGATSPAVGPLPPIYVPRSPQAATIGLLWPAALRAARRASAWVTRHHPQHGPAGQDGRSHATLPGPAAPARG